MLVAEKLSLCPECTACPEVEILHVEGRAVAVRIGEGEERITLPAAAWNTLVRYIREGVLPPPPRGENRYRRYSKEVVELLQFIRTEQGLGFTLSEIKEIVELHSRGCAPCAHVQTLVERKVADLDRQLAGLVGLRRKLKRLMASWKRPTTGPRIEAAVCPTSRAPVLQ